MQNKKWLSMLVAFVVSIGLWFYVVTVENPIKETTLYNVPVSFSGQELLREDYNLLIVDNNVLSGVEMTFSGKISDLNKLQQNKSEMELVIDITHLRNTQEYTLSYDIGDVAFPAAVSAQDVSLTLKSPNAINVTLGKLASKTVPVQVQQNVTPREGFVAGRLTQNYNEITVEGPEDVIKQITGAQALFERENVDQSITANVPLILLDAQGNVIEDSSVTSSVAEIEVSLPVFMYKDVPLEISVIDGGGAAEKDVAIDIDPQVIRLSGDATVLESIQSIKLPNIDLAGLMTNDEIVTKTIPIPEGCNNLSGELEADVSVKIKNKAIRTINVSSSSFQKKELPADMDVKYNTTTLAVTIRANEADIDQITEDNIRVVVDFSGMSTAMANNVSVPATIYIDGFEGAGAVGNTAYTVNLDIVSAGS